MVTAPRDAEETSKAYLAITPLTKRGTGGFQVASRFWMSEVLSSTFRSLLGMSNTIVSPSATAAWQAFGFPDGFVGHFAAWDPDGSGPLPTQLVAGGELDHPDGTSSPLVIRWDGSGWQTIDAGLEGHWVSALTAWDLDGAGPQAARHGR